MSTSVSKINGFVVVTQIFPEGGESKDSIPMAPASEKVSLAPAAEPECQVPMLAMTRLFLRGQPKPLGVVQICVGCVTMAIGLIGLLTSFHGLTPLITGAAYVLSGILTIVSSKGINKGLIKGTLTVNLLSTGMAVAGVVVFCMELFVRPESIECAPLFHYYWDSWECRSLSQQYTNLLYGIKGLLLSMAVLEACVALTVCVFSCKAICQSSSSQPVMVVIPRNLEESAPLICSDVALLGSEDDPTQPIPYVA